MHEKPGPLPSKPSLPILAVHCHDDQNKSEEGRRREAKETIQDGEDSTSHRDRPTLVTVVEYQASSSQGSSDSLQSPANSTLLTDLSFPIQCNWCSRKTSSNTFHENPGPLPSRPSSQASAVQGYHVQTKSEEGWKREVKEAIQEGEDSGNHPDHPSCGMTCQEVEPSDEPSSQVSAV